MKSKCYGCGLVNKLEATECGRCGGQLGVKPVETLNPFEGEAPSKFSGIRLLVMLSVAVVGSFVAYQALKVEKPVVKPLTQEQVAEQLRNQTSPFEQKMAEGTTLPKPIEFKPGLSQTKYDTRNILRDPMQNQPRPGTGGYTPPPPGTSYHMDKYGGMHQR